ncbi:MAG: hypothetical protein OEM63_01540 [Gammaproteobacteria bacterium]|nr:hypothetical protein [Gammaproteobacteria bacterium]
MNSHNTKPAFAFHKTPGVTKDDIEKSKVVTASLSGAELAIADEADDYCDPYNSTGKHVVLKAKLTKRDRD